MLLSSYTQTLHIRHPALSSSGYDEAGASENTLFFSNDNSYAEERLRSDSKVIIDFTNNNESQINSLSSILIDSANSDEDRISAANDLAKILFGSDYKLIPNYKVSQDTANAIKKFDEGYLTILGASTIEEQALKVDEWLHDAGMVRSNISDLELFGLLVNCFNSNQDLNLIPAQLPHDYGEVNQWLSLQVEEEHLKDGKICLAMNTYAGFYTDLDSSDHALCGLIIDEWTEIIPWKDQTAALSLNFNQPNSQAPQCLLLAVPSVQPDQAVPESLKWNQTDIQNMLEQTLNDAIKRNQDYEAIENSHLGQFIPLTIYPVSSLRSDGIHYSSNDFIN